MCITSFTRQSVLFKFCIIDSLQAVFTYWSLISPPRPHVHHPRTASGWGETVKTATATASTSVALQVRVSAWRILPSCERRCQNIMQARAAAMGARAVHCPAASSHRRPPPLSPTASARLLMGAGRALQRRRGSNYHYADVGRKAATGRSTRRTVTRAGGVVAHDDIRIVDFYELMARTPRSPLTRYTPPDRDGHVSLLACGPGVCNNVPGSNELSFARY